MVVYTLGELAEALSAELLGDMSQSVHRVCHPLQVRGSEDLALVLDAQIVPQLSALNIQTALVPDGLEIEGIPNQLKVKRPKVALAKLLDLYNRPAYVAPGIHPSAVVDPSAKLGANVSIGPLCVIGPHAVIGDNTRLIAQVFVGAETTLGEECLIYPGVVVGDRVQIGARVVIQSNASIGSDGFSYVTESVGSVESAKATGRVEAQNTAILRINSIGTVVLEDDVEIGANTCVDRATLGETRIKRGSKLDNLVQIAHNVSIGENCLFAGQVGIAGSCKIGNRVVLGGHVGVADHVTIEDDAMAYGMSGIGKTVPAKTIVAGAPAVERKDYMYQLMSVKRVKGLGDQVKTLASELESLKAQLAELQQGQPV